MYCKIAIQVVFMDGDGLCRVLVNRHKGLYTLAGREHPDHYFGYNSDDTRSLEELDRVSSLLIYLTFSFEVLQKDRASDVKYDIACGRIHLT